jgi:hypothetical protein
MNTDHIRQVLSELNIADEARIDQLATDIKERSWRPSRELTAIWQGYAPEPAHKAAVILGELDDLALRPLAEAEPPDDAAKRAWLISTLVDNELELRQLIVARLDQFLGDRSVVPLPPVVAPIDELPPPRRVCDEAYVHLRRFLNVATPLEQQLMDEDIFLNLPLDLKDQAIQKFRESGVWVQLTEDIGPGD